MKNTGGNLLMVNTDGSATFSSGAEPCTCVWCKPLGSPAGATSSAGYEYGPAASYPSAGYSPAATYTFTYPNATTTPTWTPVLSDDAVARKVLREIALDTSATDHARIAAARALLDHTDLAG